MQENESAVLIDRQLQAVADRTRLRILLLLSSGERCVCDIVNTLQLPQPKVSRHLATLRAAALVRSRIHAN
ncbi:MAG TPA: metalloregulator ArsR/SmtB family transcription factor, partial [Caldilineaceae bacterium]|nr:metalloregulator ArsR/SmtB family transcription factor [Caldilineaceae bacterium]